MFLGTSQTNFASIKDKIVDITRLSNKSSDIEDKTIFLNELGLGQCDDQSSHDNDGPWEEFLDGDFIEENNFESELADEVFYTFFKILLLFTIILICRRKESVPRIRLNLCLIYAIPQLIAFSEIHTQQLEVIDIGYVIVRLA